MQFIFQSICSLVSFSYILTQQNPFLFLSTGLRFVLAPGSSPLSDLFIPKDTTLQEYEVCPEAGVIIEHMRNTIGKNGGSGLIVDYGKDGPSSNSLRVRILVCVC